MSLPCHGCAYRAEIAGDEHSRCLFDWSQDSDGLVAKFAMVTPRVAQWFRFPFNYDPTWGPSECGQRSDVRDRRRREGQSRARWFLIRVSKTPWSVVNVIDGFDHRHCALHIERRPDGVLRYYLLYHA